MKTCKVCGGYSAGFRKNRQRADGLAAQCKECDKAERSRCRGRIQGYMRRWVEENPKRAWACHTIVGHRKKGCVVLFTRKQLEEVVGDHCAICGVALNWVYGSKDGRAQPNSPTLDRIDNGTILKLEDVQVTCLQCNTTKGSRSMAQFVEYCRLVAARQGS